MLPTCVAKRFLCNDRTFFVVIGCLSVSTITFTCHKFHHSEPFQENLAWCLFVAQMRLKLLSSTSCFKLVPFHPMWTAELIPLLCNYKSSGLGVKCGVPQGSVLEPKQFIQQLQCIRTLRTNDQQKLLDTNTTKMQRKTWFDLNKLSSNLHKSKTIILYYYNAWLRHKSCLIM